MQEPDRAHSKASGISWDKAGSLDEPEHIPDSLLFTTPFMQLKSIIRKLGTQLHTETRNRLTIKAAHYANVNGPLETRKLEVIKK